MNLPVLILLEQTRKDKGLPLFTRHTSHIYQNCQRANKMNKKSKHHTDEHF